jgi:hypothetical protein
MEQDYGDKVRVVFHDMSRQEVRQRHADVLEAAEQHNLPYPLTAVNDVFRLAGGISYYAVQKVVQELLDNGGTPSDKTKE